MMKIAGSQSSPINHLNELMQRRDSCPFPTITRIIETAKATIGISESNYLAWQPKFLGPTGYIDGISTEDLGDNHLMWGYDPDDRLFITFQYQIASTDEKGKKQLKKKVLLFSKDTRTSWVLLLKEDSKSILLI